jgi:hypothetical protein
MMSVDDVVHHRHLIYFASTKAFLGSLCQVKLTGCPHSDIDPDAPDIRFNLFNPQRACRSLTQEYELLPYAHANSR